MPTELLSLAKIFNNRLFRIPDYQRGFAWGERQLSDFWSDLLRVGSDRTHYCGQLTLEKVTEDGWRQWTDDSWLVQDADYDPNFVVDGQQRLTTSVILLQCLLEGLPGEQLVTGQSIQELRQRYLAKRKGDVLASCLFGYARDNPIDKLFAEDGKGFYDLPGLKYILFEYEESLRIAAKATAGKISWQNFRGARNSVEHVYPQNPIQDEWPIFSSLSCEHRRLLCHSLGNLVAVSVAKNASLSRRAFLEKVKGTADSPGFSQGSFSELRIAQNSDWTPKTILERGIELLQFIEKRWAVDLEGRPTKVSLLKLDFIEPNPIFDEFK